MLVDYLNCSSESFQPCVDIAAKSKLFSVIVDSLETAKQVLEINQQIRGGVISIYPLETMEEMKRPTKTAPEGTKSMLDIVTLSPKADKRLAHLVEHIFGKVVLVKGYDEAMAVAKQHNLTCITSEFEVVYAGAFISRVGHFNRAQIDRYGAYRQLAAL